MSKIRAIRKILSANNYLVVTDKESEASISPLYADKFRVALKQELDGLQLVEHRHKQMLSRLADQELGEIE